MRAHAVIPYDQRLARFPAYLQQLEMESNGKSVTLDGAPIEGGTAPVLFGEPGTNGQHAFFQLLHQGTEIVPIDFLIAAAPFSADPQQHQLLIANCLAQSEALMRGRSLAEVEADSARHVASTKTRSQSWRRIRSLPAIGRRALFFTRNCRRGCSASSSRFMSTRSSCNR